MSDHGVPSQAPAVSGDPWDAWAQDLGDRNRWVLYLPDEQPSGWLEVQPSAYGWQWRHVSLYGDPMGWQGAAPTAQQAMLDAQVHARRCTL